MRRRPEDFVNDFLLAGEIAGLFRRIIELSGFEGDFSTLRKEVKLMEAGCGKLLCLVCPASFRLESHALCFFAHKGKGGGLRND